jgi:hypothetical protein
MKFHPNIFLLSAALCLICAPLPIAAQTPQAAPSAPKQQLNDQNPDELKIAGAKLRDVLNIDLPKLRQAQNAGDYVTALSGAKSALATVDNFLLLFCRSQTGHMPKALEEYTKKGDIESIVTFLRSGLQQENPQAAQNLVNLIAIHDNLNSVISNLSKKLGS